MHTPFDIVNIKIRLIMLSFMERKIYGKVFSDKLKVVYLVEDI